MPSRKAAPTPITEALSDVDRLKRVISKIHGSQVRAAEPRGHMRAVALAWFDGHRASIVQYGVSLQSVDTDFQLLLTAAEKASSTSKVCDALKRLRSNLVRLQAEVVALPNARSTASTPPSFAKVPDPQMQQVLTRRWLECGTCVEAGAPLAATVMMGGLLESLLLARVNRETDKSIVFKAAAAPRDEHNKTLPLNTWTLKHYIAVAHELGWISQTVKDLGQVLGEYRNYIHPYKELSHQLSLADGDARMLWSVSQAIALQLL